MVNRLGGDNPVIHKNIESLYWTSDTNMILYKWYSNKEKFTRLLPLSLLSVVAVTATVVVIAIANYIFA